MRNARCCDSDEVRLPTPRSAPMRKWLATKSAGGICVADPSGRRLAAVANGRTRRRIRMNWAGTWGRTCSTPAEDRFLDDLEKDRDKGDVTG